MPKTPWIKKRTPREQRYEITKVVILDLHDKKITIENAQGGIETFLYDGTTWKWAESHHYVDPGLCKSLSKEYRRYLKKINKE